MGGAPVFLSDSLRDFSALSFFVLVLCRETKGDFVEGDLCVGLGRYRISTRKVLDGGNVLWDANGASSAAVRAILWVACCCFAASARIQLHTPARIHPLSRRLLLLPAARTPALSPFASKARQGVSTLELLRLLLFSPCCERSMNPLQLCRRRSAGDKPSYLFGYTSAAHV